MKGIVGLWMVEHNDMLTIKFAYQILISGPSIIQSDIFKRMWLTEVSPNINEEMQ